MVGCPDENCYASDETYFSNASNLNRHIKKVHNKNVADFKSQFNLSKHTISCFLCGVKL